MAVIDQPQVDVAKPGWYPDPYLEHNLRYHNGDLWTDHVTHYGPTPCGSCSYRDEDLIGG